MPNPRLPVCKQQVCKQQKPSPHRFFAVGCSADFWRTTIEPDSMGG